MNRFPRIFLRSVHYGLQIYPYLDIASKLRSLLTVIEWQTALAWESSKCLWTPRKCRLEMLPFRFSMLIRRSNGLLSDWVKGCLPRQSDFVASGARTGSSQAIGFRTLVRRTVVLGAELAQNTWQRQVAHDRTQPLTDHSTFQCFSLGASEIEIFGKYSLANIQFDIDAHIIEHDRMRWWTDRGHPRTQEHRLDTTASEKSLQLSTIASGVGNLCDIRNILTLTMR